MSSSMPSPMPFPMSFSRCDVPWPGLPMLVAALVCAAPLASAQPIFDQPGQVAWIPVDDPPAEAFMVDPDGMHYVRSESDDSYVHCLPDGDPNHPERVSDFGQARQGFRSHFMLIRAADRSAVYVVEQRTLDEYSLRVLRLDCRSPDPDRLGEVLAELRGEGHPFAELVRSERQRAPVPEQRPDGRLCIAGLGGMTCFDPVAPVPDLVVDAAEIVAAEPFDPAFAEPAGARERTPLVELDQRIGRVVPGPDGRLVFTFFRLMHFLGDEPPRTWGESEAESAQIFELTADDRLIVRSPQWVPGALTPLTEPELYWPEMDAWIARPTRGWHYSDARAANGGAIPAGGGWGGEGLLVVPADRSGFGFVSFTRALIRAHDCTMCTSETRQIRLRVAPDGRLLAWYQAGLARDPIDQTYAFAFDPDTLDLDDDGLSRAEEVELGTDPGLYDSDGGGTSDRDEVRLWGTDPLDATDDYARAVDPVGFGMSESGLIKLRLPTPENGTRYGWGNLTGAGPLCLESGECYGPDGRVVVVVPPGIPAAFNSLDGEHLFYWSDGDLRVRSITSGADRAVARAAALPVVDQGRPVVVVPVDDRRAWVADAHQIAWLEGAPGTPDMARVSILFDLDQARALVGLPDEPVGAVNSQSLRPLELHPLDPLGYHHESDRFVFSVAGAYENWVLAVGRSGEAQIIRHARELIDLRHDALRAPNLPPERYPRPGPPYALRRIGDGGYLSVRGGFGPDLRRGPYPTRTGGFLGTVVWGGVGIRGVATGSGSFFPGLTAFVGYRLTVDPGDILWFPSEKDGDFVPRGTMYKSGAQGGFVRLMTQPDVIFRRVVGADIDAAGRLCVINHVPGEPWSDSLLVLEPDGSGDRVPLAVRLVGGEPGLRDCAWASDGALHLLLDEPPRLATMDAATGAVVPYRDLDVPPSAEVLRLVDRPTDGFEVLHTASELRGLNYGPSGRRLALTMQNELQIDGRTVAGPLQLVYDDRDRITELDPQIGLFADLIERPDGLVVIHPFRVELESADRAWLTRHWVVDPATGQVAELGVGDHQVSGAATIRVPGGEARDPWTGEPIGAGPGGASGFEGPEPPEAPSGGMQVPQNTTTEGGCRAAPGAGPSLWWGLLVLGLATRRRPRSRGIVG